MGSCSSSFRDMADASVVGNFASNDAFAAVSSVVKGHLTFLIIGLFNGIAVGGGVVISRYFGAKNREGVQKAIHANFLFRIWALVIATAAGLIFDSLCPADDEYAGQRDAHSLDISGSTLRACSR